MNKKYAKVQSTRRSLIMSVLSLMLCFAMLIGTTYAWFTDSVTSGTNRIVAGNLDVEMYYKNALTSKNKDVEAEKWANVATADADPKFFVDASGEEILWEPGVVSICDFEVRNVGTLALKYKLNTEFEDGNDSGSTMKLSSVIKAAVVAADTDVSTRENAIAAGKAVEGGFQNLAVFANEGALAPQGKDAFKVILYWEPTENDDVYNMNNEKQDEAHDNTMWIDIDIKLIATQLTEEKDSFDIDYDKDATYPGNTASDAALKFDDGDPTIVTGIEDDTAETVVIPATATKIADNAFKGNTHIKDITMPVNTEIGESAFEGCDNLENVTLVVPDGQTANVEFRAFAECEGLKNITVNGDANLTNATFQFGTIQHATEVETEYVFNGNVTVGKQAFSSNYASSCGGTVIFNGNVTFVTSARDIPFIGAQVDNVIFNCDGATIDFGAGPTTALMSNINFIFKGVPSLVKGKLSADENSCHMYCNLEAWKNAGFLDDTITSGYKKQNLTYHDISELTE
ncbi:MAG: leucine-rich repeat protein [Firmicutes bacterium]|nr:leucine-rich repeat protein [Candidatus Colimorpha enterica]